MGHTSSMLDLVSALLFLLSAKLINTRFVVNASSSQRNGDLRHLAFFTSTTDDRHNPNVNPRNSKSSDTTVK